MKLMHLRKFLALALAFCSMTAIISVVLAQGNDWVAGDLRVDSGEIYGARDYRVSLLTDAAPATAGGYTAAYLGLDLALFDGTPYSAQFTQVGLLTDEGGIRWFVYAEPGVTCLLGSPEWGTRGCLGDPNHLVAFGSWHRVELVTYGPGQWIARVYDDGGTGYDVAIIWSDGTRIYFAESATEEAYSVSPDPFLQASFYHWHPQLKIGSVFQEWPESVGGNNSTILVWPASICPDHYGASPNWTGDERAWFAGTGGQVCSWLLFPSVHVYLPAVLKNSGP